MDARVAKLATKLGIPLDTAKALVEAGLDTPKRVKAAKDAELEAVPGIGKATKTFIRDRLKLGRQP